MTGGGGTWDLRQDMTDKDASGFFLWMDWPECGPMDAPESFPAGAMRRRESEYCPAFALPVWGQRS